MNFIHPDLPETDQMLFFGIGNYLDNTMKLDEVFEKWPGNRIEDFAVFCGSFNSLSQARKNGFSGELKPGYQEIKIGKKRLYILNMFDLSK